MSEKSEIGEIVRGLTDSYKKKSILNPENLCEQPDRETLNNILNRLIKLVYPAYFRVDGRSVSSDEKMLSELIEDVFEELSVQVATALCQKAQYEGHCKTDLAEEGVRITKEFLGKLPMVREYAETDVQASFEGDPAAFNTNEIVLCYPGLRAVTISRIAHELFLLGVPIIPRMWTEYAHSRTGIDIHPGATIGKYFCIDHGTGIVIGETTVIGEYVKVYQGVTIGALSTRGGQSLRGVKRHPTIEDRVTIYAGASILGGETVIGHDAVIGSNAFITESVEANSRVSMKNPVK